MCVWVPECQNKECMCATVTYISCVIEDYKHIEKVSGKSFHELISIRKTRGLCR